MSGAQVHGGMIDLYEVTKEHREEIVREVERSRSAKRLRAARKLRAGRSLASILMWELESGASHLLKLSRTLKIPLLRLATCSVARRKP